MTKKRWFAGLVSVWVMSLTACGQMQDKVETGEISTQTTVSEENTEAESLTDAEAFTVEVEQQEETQVEAVSSSVWIPSEAPAVRKEISEEEQRAAELAILEKGTFLFSGKTDKGYYPNDISWLKNAGTEDAIALIYACDDKTHGGWGVLGMSINNNQENIAAMSDEPEKERLLVYTMAELMEIVGITNTSEFTSFSIGAWNGGRIAGLYYLPQDVAAELDEYLEQVDNVEKIIHTYTGELSNENAIDSARKVYQYLQDTYGKACITGQMESTWMGSPNYEMLYIEENTGKLPAIRGLDFMHNDFGGVVSRAKDWWEQGGIVTICWHTGADFSSGYDESKADDINWNEAFVPGSDTYNALLEGMDRAVPYLQNLEDAGVPVLWRPFHELDGGWFWWSKGGSENFVKLWQLMYSRYTEYWGLDNLIWVYGYSQNGGDMAAWYPGDDYVDLLGADSYTEGPNEKLFAECESVIPEGMPIVFHECGKIPTEEEMVSTDAKWLFFMTWHTEWLTEVSNGNTIELLNEVYNSDYFITLDELPNFK
ncbi:MAG: hypothetical protein IJ326_01100 [Lachnospiraceae bacterium]|nr:hypothetical protein [Lachnospiraceae bacterium]